MTENDQIRDYLLGTMTSEAQSRFEDEYFSDADRFELLVAAEDDLVDSYVRGELSAAGRRQFESHYLNSSRRQVDLPFARALAEISADPKPELHAHRSRFKFPWRVWPETALLASGLAAMLIAVAWLSVANLRLRHELERTQFLSSEQAKKQASQQKQIAELEKNASKGSAPNQGPEIARLETPAAPAQVIRLMPGSLRAPGEETPTVLLRPDNAAIELRLSLGSFPRAPTDYLARVHSPDIPHIDIAFENLKATRSDAENSVLLRIKSKTIEPGDYIVSLYGSKGAGGKEVIASYSFRARTR